jgi:hypothetical protein
MASPTAPFSFPNFPPEMVAAVKADAARDADLVGGFLSALGIRGTPEKPVALPLRFLLYLKAALHLWLWEVQGFFFHRAVGLPAAQEAIAAALGFLEDPDADPTLLRQTVLRLSIERFAWNGLRELGAEVALDDSLDEAALDALAEYLWACRAAEPATASGAR